MKKLYQYLGYKEPQHKGIFGIEIEAEGRDMRAVHTRYWHSEDDGSLRGHYPESRSEFVLNAPITAKEVVPALNELVAALKGATFDFSFRTSVHVHMNVQDFTHNQILNMVYTYMLLEEPLMTYCGKSRKANRFCLRLGDAEGLMDVVERMVKDGEFMYAHCNDNCRYSAINLAALNKYGSIEFRGMRGNMDIDVIQTWTRALGAIHAYAAAQESPTQIREHLEKAGPRKFIADVLGDVAGAFNYPRILKDMSKSYSISLDLPYSFERYKRVEKPAPVYGELVFIKHGANEHKQITENAVEGREIVYTGNHYRYENHNFKILGPYQGPAEEVLKAMKVAAAPKPIPARKPRVNVIQDFE